ncbi:MAG TPA: Smr/MutS family protein [Usitatibacteraceae bacterium]|nr:Smr/MutS family protein [Usitatibacteraceae bacterium]
MKPARPVQAPADDDADLFRREMRDVSPARPSNRVAHRHGLPPPIPVQRIEDERAVLEELARLAGGVDDIEIEEDHAYLRPGLPREVLRKLRRVHWVVQDELDLHGLTGDEAALETSRFLADCTRRGLRCLRIIHGKGLGSHNREPVLKGRIRKLLARKSEVLAFSEPPPAQGGSGAVIVLLDSRAGP